MHYRWRSMHLVDWRWKRYLWRHVGNTERNGFSLSNFPYFLPCLVPCELSSAMNTFVYFTLFWQAKFDLSLLPCLQCPVNCDTIHYSLQIKMTWMTKSWQSLHVHDIFFETRPVFVNTTEPVPLKSSLNLRQFTMLKDGFWPKIRQTFPGTSCTFKKGEVYWCQKYSEGRSSQ